MFITGQVLDSLGQPVPSAAVRILSGLSQLPDTAELADVDCHTRADGSFRVEVFSPGTYRACAGLADCLWSDEAEVHLKPGEPATPILLQLPMSVSIEGHLFDMAGSPVEKMHLLAFVDLEASDMRIPSSLSAAEFFGTPKARSDETGRFVLEPVRAGVEYHVRAREPNEVRTTLGSATPVTIELPPHGGHGRFTYGWCGLRAEQPGVELELGRGARLTSQPSNSVVVHFSTEPGALPEGIIFELRRMGPHGRALFYESAYTRIDEHGAAIIDGLEPLARYSLCFDDSSGPTAPTATFVAGRGPVGLIVELESRYAITLDAAMLLSEGLGPIWLEVGKRTPESSEVEPHYLRQLSASRTQVTTLLTTGKYSARLSNHDENLILQDFVVTSHPSTIELVIADDAECAAETDPKMIGHDQ